VSQYNDILCARCGAEWGAMYLIAGLGWRCGACEAAWRGALANWRGSVKGRDKRKQASTEAPSGAPKQGDLL